MTSPVLPPASAPSLTAAADTLLPRASLRAPGSRQFKPKAGFSPVGIAVMVAAHGLLGYALVSGMASKAIEIIKKPLDATIIAEVKLPPPPPPPTPPVKIEKAAVVPKVAAPPPPAYIPPPDIAPAAAATQAITAVQTTQAVAPPPAAPPAPPAPPPAPPPAATAPAPAKADMALICPKQVKPEIPKKAIDDGIEGTVKAEVRVRGGKVVDVRIISGPRALHAAVRAALQRYECSGSADTDIIATQDFVFKLE